MNTPNHICKNPNCQKSYYFCSGCTINKNKWADVGCCPECAEVYWGLIAESRKKTNIVEQETEDNEQLTITKTRKPRAKKETTETPVDDVDSEE